MADADDAAGVEFVFPDRPVDLEAEDCTLPVRCGPDAVDLAAMSRDEAEECADRLLYDVCNSDALSIVEPAVFDAAYSLVKAFPSLADLAKRRLLDGLASNAAVAAVSAASLTANAGNSGPPDPDAASAHRSALSAYTFFLHWLTTVAEEHARSAPATAAAAAAAAAGGRGRRAAAAHVDPERAPFCWDAGRERVGRALGALSDVDLWALFRPAPPPEGLLAAWTATGTALLSSPAGARAPAARDGAGRALAAAALRYGHLDQVAGALIDALRKTEHLPVILADLAASASAAAGGDDRLGRELLASVARADPGAYEGASSADTAAARSVGAFLVELAERLPRAVAAGFAPLVAHLGGRSHAIRSGVIGAAAALVHRAYGEGAEPDGPAGTGAAGGAAGAGSATATDAAAVARLRTKQHLLDLLVERAYDASAFTRARVLHAWAALADRGSLPLGHWLCVTRLAADRLEDRAALVRRAALQLLQALMLYNPFGPVLPAASFDASLAEYEARLSAAEAAAAAETGADKDAAAARWGDGVVKVEAEDDGGAAPTTRAEEAADAMVDALVADEEGGGGEGEGRDAADAPEPPHPPPQLDSNAEQLRALVASLRTASAFARALTAALPTAVQLLGSATLSDVTEALSLLVCARKFELDGAEAALRRVLLLVFSREQGVPDAVVSAVDDLRLAGREPDAAADGLVDLAAGATLGELSALDEVVGRLLAVPAGGTPADSRARPAVVRALWPAAARAAAAVVAAGEGAAARSAALPRLRAALAVISMAARSRPALVTDNMPALLAAGFSFRDGGAARHAAAALRAAAAGTPPGADASAFAPAHTALLRLLLAPATDAKWGLDDDAWYGAADAALRALLDSHPDPQGVGAALLRAAARAALGGSAAAAATPAEAADAMEVDASTTPPRAGPVARLAFLAGGVALSHLVAADTAARAARRARLVAAAAADAAAGAAAAASAGADAGSEDDDIAAQLGVGPAPGGEADLDALRDAAEAAVLGAPGSAPGALAPLVSALATAPGAPAAWRAALPSLDAATSLALAKCMAVDGGFCAAHLAPLFSRITASPPDAEQEGGSGGAEPRAGDPPPPATPLSARVRGGLVVAAGDLAVRWPNAVEPWTAALYAPLDDAHPAVRRDATMVLSHLVLNDMVKVKGHAGRLAARLVDGDERVSALAGLFFHELARRASKGSHPVYNMIPDVLSSLSTGPGALSPADFQGVMRGLLAHVGKDRQADALVDKLAGRMGPDAAPATVRGMAFCLAQLNLSEKGVRRLGELLPSYRPWLGDDDVLANLKAVAARARKLPKAGPAFKAEVDGWEARMGEVAAELRGGGEEGAGGGEGGAGPSEPGAAEAGDAPAAPGAAEAGDAPAAPAAAADGEVVEAVRRMTLDGDGPGDALVVVEGAPAAPPPPPPVPPSPPAAPASDAENDAGAANASPSPARPPPRPRGRKAAAVAPKAEPGEADAAAPPRATRARRTRAG